MVSHSKGGTCPRCKNYCGLGIRTDKIFEHRTPAGNRCPAAGVTWTQAREGWTSLNLRTYRYLLKEGRTADAEAYKAERIKP